MNLEKYKPIFTILKISFVLYILHKLLFLVFKAQLQPETFYYSLEVLYLFFSAASLLILFILVKVKERNLDQVGMTFLLITSVKMIFCYVIVRPIFNSLDHNSTIQKINFFTLFILFLAIETIVTIRILNNKQ